MPLAISLVASFPCPGAGGFKSYPGISQPVVSNYVQDFAPDGTSVKVPPKVVSNQTLLALVNRSIARVKAE